MAKAMLLRRSTVPLETVAEPKKAQASLDPLSSYKYWVEARKRRVRAPDTALKWPLSRMLFMHRAVRALVGLVGGERFALKTAVARRKLLLLQRWPTTIRDPNRK